MPLVESWPLVFWFGLKSVIILAGLAYLVFSLIFWQKVRLLSRIIETEVSARFIFLCLANVLSVLTFLILAIVWL